MNPFAVRVVHKGYLDVAHLFGLKGAMGKKPYKKKPYKKDGGGNDKQMAYLSEAIESLVRKGLKKAVKKHRKKRSRDDSSSSSDSE